MNDQRTDAELVAAHLGGDRSALAAIYDRYADALYDTAAAMLRDRHEAADVSHDIFLIAAERLGQLRQPERLKPWLFAIARNEIYRHTKRRSRNLPTDFTAMDRPEMAAPTTSDAEGGDVAFAELADLVRQAATGLDERDQLVLELSVRQGLQGSDLADALGVSVNQSYTLVHRMRERVEKSLTAFAVAKGGRKECGDLAAIVGEWTGEFSVLLRKRVARHIESCAACERTKRKLAVLPIIGSAPAFAAPPLLRDRVLQSVAVSSPTPPHAYTFTERDGFPTMAGAARKGLWLMLGAAAAVLLGATAGGALAVGFGGGDDSAAPTTVSVTTTIGAPPSIDAAIPPTVPATSAATTVPTSSTSSSSTSSSSTVPTTVAAPGVLTLSTTNLALGQQPTGVVQLTNTGGQPIDWSIDGRSGPFTAAPEGGTLGPGESAPLTVAFDRDDRLEGDYLGGFTLGSSAGGGGLLAVSAAVDNAPVVTITSVSPTGQITCQFSNPTVNGTATDESALQPVVLSWLGPSGQTGSVVMKLRGAVLVGIPQVSDGVSPEPGAWVLTVTATDARGNATSVDEPFPIGPC